METIESFARNGLGAPAQAADIRNQYVPRHGDGNLPEDLKQAKTEEEERQELLTSVSYTIVDDVADDTSVETEEQALLKRIRYLEEKNYSLSTEVDMYRRFFGSKDEEDQRLFMQSVIFLANTALEFKYDQEKIEHALGVSGVCMHPEEELHDTGFGVVICRACRKHVEPEVEAPCAHDKTVEYGTVGALQCLDCGVNLPRAHFSRLDDEEMSLADAVGVSIPRGQPVLNPSLAPRMLPGGD